jgi:hypothetical protein
LLSRRRNFLASRVYPVKKIFLTIPLKTHDSVLVQFRFSLSN